MAVADVIECGKRMNGNAFYGVLGPQKYSRLRNRQRASNFDHYLTREIVELQEGTISLKATLCTFLGPVHGRDEQRSKGVL